MINPAFLSPSRTVSSNPTITSLINLSSTILRRIRDRKTSQDPSFATEPPKNLNPRGYNFLLIPPAHKTRIAILKTTSSQNRNTNPLAYHNTNSFNMQNDHDITVTEDRAEILTWLSPFEPYLRHHEIRTNRVKGVGDWVLQTEEFRSWWNGDGQGESRKATIFCSGKLGVGKTYIR